MVDHRALHRMLATYVHTTVDAYEIGPILYQVTDQSREVLGCHGAGVSVADREGLLRFVTATDEAVTRVEEDQVETREGPCYDAFRSGKWVSVSDLDAIAGWPAYRRQALADGFRAVGGFPISVDGTSIGALNIYWDGPHDWTRDELEAAQLVADMAAGYIANLRVLSASRRLAEQLQQALDSRTVVEQAKGIIAARHGVDVSSAFQRLRDHARAHQLKVHDVARDVVEGRLEL